MKRLEHLKFVAACLTGAMVFVSIVSACTAKTTSVGPGGECFLATDCAPGLICIERPDKTRICSDDLSRVTGRPPAEGGAARDAVADSARDAAAADAPSPTKDSGDVDTGLEPDSGEPIDAAGE